MELGLSRAGGGAATVVGVAFVPFVAVPVEWTGGSTAGRDGEEGTGVAGESLATAVTPAGALSDSRPATGSQRKRPPNTDGTQSLIQASGRNSVSRATYDSPAS